MLSANQIKSINALKLKKNREDRRQFIAEGSKLVIDLLHSDHKVQEILATSEWIDLNHAILLRSKVIYRSVTEKEIARITALNTPGPVLAVVEIPSITIQPDSFSDKLILALDDIRDPGNLGTIIRIADWFGIDAVICSETTVDLYNPKVVQATMGSIARVRVYYTDLAGFISQLPENIKIYGAFLKGDIIYTKELSDKGVIIIGNESNGISAGLEKFVTDRLFIPPCKSGNERDDHAESLNASVAAAIICSEFRRRIL
jgi:TrmH family RNA methyltransferase